MHRDDKQPAIKEELHGIVHAVRGAVVDVVFTGSGLPPINSSLIVAWDQPTPLTL